MQPEKKPIARRRQYLIDKRFQHGVIWRFVGVVVISILLSHLVTIGFMKLRELMGGTEEELMYFANPVHQTLAFARILDILWLPMLISCALGIVLVVILGMFFSHRIAGPMFNLKRMMKQVEEGKLDVVMRIRITDEFHDVENSFNQMVAGLRTRLERVWEKTRDLPPEKRQDIDNVLLELKLERKEYK